MKYETSDYNNEKISVWLNEHTMTCGYWVPGTNGLLPQGAIGGAITYCFTPTNLGLVIKISCACGDECDVTEYKNW